MPDQAVQRAEVARAHRKAQKNPGDEAAVRQLDDARRTYYETRLADTIERTLAKAPPLTDAQRARLARLLFGGAA